jgi:hypothetical protein
MVGVLLPPQAQTPGSLSESRRAGATGEGASATQVASALCACRSLVRDTMMSSLVAAVHAALLTAAHRGGTKSTMSTTAAATHDYDDSRRHCLQSETSEASPVSSSFNSCCPKGTPDAPRHERIETNLKLASRAAQVAIDRDVFRS